MNASDRSDRTIPVNRMSAHQTRSSDRGKGPAPGAAGQPPHDAVGAYLLDALPEAEREAFEHHLGTCEACLQEVQELAPVVGLLPRLLELDGNAIGAAGSWSEDETDSLAAPVLGEPLPAPSSGLRDRILAAARTETDDTGDESPPDTGTGGTATPLSGSSAPASVEGERTEADPGEPEDQDASATVAAPVRMRPRGRIRPGVAPRRDDAQPVVREPVLVAPRREPRPAAPADDSDDAGAPTWLPRWETISRLGYERLAAGLLALVAVGAVLWALGLQSRLDDRGEELRTLREQVEQQQNQLAQVRGLPEVTMLNVSATQDGPPDARGTLFYAPGSGQGTLSVTGLTAPPQGRVYQLWYLGGERAVAEPGGTFSVDAQGNALLPITQQVAPFQQIGLTVEPEGGSQTPTLPVIAVGANG